MAGSDSVLRSPASMLRAASVAIVGASERARWASQIFGNLRQNGYGGKIHLVNPRQQTVYGERCFPSLRDIGAPVDHAMVIVPAANVADVLTDAEAAGVKSATIYASAVGDGESEPSRARGAWLKNFLASRQIARQRPELHGLLQLPRKTVRLSQHRIVQGAAGPGRRNFPVRRHHAVLAEERVRPRLALFLCGVVGQRSRSRSRRLSEFHGRRSAHQTNRAVHRRHPATASFHARRGARARSRQAGAGDQDRRHAKIAHGGALAYRRHRRRLCGVSGDVRALRHRQLPLARRSCGMHAGVPGRPAAEGPAHRLRHHLGRHGRSALRLCRDRRRGGARIQRRDATPR